ncbi:MAG: hypothetical protein Q7S02_02010, partial [bacterium]|nr:hypothetical protein [bacterium]
MAISLAAEPLTHLWTFPLTNTLLMALFVSAALLIVSFLARRSFNVGGTLVPSGIGNAVEAVVDGLLS